MKLGQSYTLASCNNLFGMQSCQPSLNHTHTYIEKLPFVPTTFVTPKQLAYFGNFIFCYSFHNFFSFSCIGSLTSSLMLECGVNIPIVVNIP